MQIRAKGVRVGITGALLFLFLGALQGCGESVMGPHHGDDDDKDECILINGVLHCM